MLTTTNIRRHTHPSLWPEEAWAELHPDQGCEWHPVPRGCLTCPFEICRYDQDPNEKRHSESRREWKRIKARFAEMIDIFNYDPQESSNRKAVIEIVADEFGITTRTVYKALEKITQW
jgi:hypothetical protein